MYNGIIQSNNELNIMINTKIETIKTLKYKVDDQTFTRLVDAIQRQREIDVAKIYEGSEKLHTSMGTVDSRDFAELVVHLKGDLMKALNCNDDKYFSVEFYDNHLSQQNQALIIRAYSLERASEIANDKLSHIDIDKNGNSYEAITEISVNDGIVHYESGEY